MPYFAKFLNEPKLSIALQDNWELKLEQIAQSTVHQNITHLAGVPTWTILLIKRLLEITGKNHLLEVWPNFELYIHGGVSFTPYREQFAALIPNGKVQYWQTYNASEGFFAVQDAPNREDMLLMLNQLHNSSLEKQLNSGVQQPEAVLICLRCSGQQGR